MTTSWAVLIDGENIPAHHAESILELVQQRGEIATKRVYGDIGILSNWRDAAARLGLEVRHLSPVSSSKNAADIALVIEAMQLVHAGFPTGFCIASSDSDFSPLVVTLKTAGRRVLGTGLKQATCTLRGTFHEWHDLQSPTATRVTENVELKQSPNALDQIVIGYDWIKLSAVGRALREKGLTYQAGHLLDEVRSHGFLDREAESGVIEIARPR